MNRADPPLLRIHEPHPGLFAYYAGRIPEDRWSDQPNWVDDGALGLGIASFALVEGDGAIIYDTHVSPAHARAIRDHLAALGVRRFTVVLSHWHLDHVAGTAAFADCEVIANSRTLHELTTRAAAIEAGTASGPPAIAPLILPTRSFDGRLDLTLGARRVQLLTFNIHSDDATLLWLPDAGILLAGDALEDCVTYVGDPQDFPAHLADLDRLAALAPRAILPNHGAEGRIAAGGYGPGLIAATSDYIRWLLALADRPDQADRPLAEVIAAPLAAGTLEWFAGYEAVHRQNIARTLAVHAPQPGAAHG